MEIWVNLQKVIGEELNNEGKKVQKIEMILTNVKKLSVGDSFGELALIENRPRAATIISREDCHLAVLEKKHFNKILSIKNKKKGIKLSLFLRNN